MNEDKKIELIFMPHAGHLIIGNKCCFHLNTYTNGFIISTVGEWWPERVSREIHADIYDREWFAKNRHLKGDTFDSAYFKKFGYEEIGAGRKYETMVFKAIKQEGDEAQCCPFTVSDWSEIDSNGYNDAVSAYKGHMALCEKYRHV